MVRMTLQDQPSRFRRLLHAQEVCDRMGWSRVTLWRRVRNGRFPLPLKDGERNAWTDEMVEAHIDQLIAERDARTAKIA